MKNVYKYLFLPYSMALMHFVSKGQSNNKPVVAINKYPDSMLNDVINHPIGINLDNLWMTTMK